MKLYSKIIHGCSQFAVCGMLMLGMSACYDEKMEWKDDYKHPDFVDLPVELREQIDRYGTLTEYAYINTNKELFKLGVGIDFNLYMNDEAYKKLVLENFKDITAGNEMKQSSLMGEDGKLDFSRVNPVINALQQDGMTIYGHTLVWHTQQRAGYLNGLIKGRPTSANMITGSNFEELSAGADSDALFGYGWNSWGGTSSREVSAEGEGYNGVDGAKSKAMIIHSTGGTGDYTVQATSELTGPFIVGHRYHVEAMMKSSVENGSARIQFQGGASTKYLPADVIGTSWAKIQHDFTAESENNKIFFDLGEVSADYYIDNVIVFDVTDVNLLSNSGTFEELSGGADADALYGYGWNSWGGTGYREVSAEGDGYDGFDGATSKAMIMHSIDGTNDFSVQVTSELNEAFVIGNTYRFEAMIRSSVENGSARVQFQGGTSAKYLDADGVGTSWKKIQHDFTAENANDKIFFDLGAVPADYYIDNVVIYDVTAITTGTGGLTPIPDDEKTVIIGNALTNYVTEVVTNFKGKVRAWDVVNEPINDNGTLRTGEGKGELASDEFYWQDYLGKDYAVKAFKAAAEADPDAILFINDFNLESTNQTKLDSLIEYVKYIEENGGRVDGIGTQMHLNVNWSDTEGIKKMFEKLANWAVANEKLIKVTELDVTFNTNANEDPASPIVPTLEQYAQQAELYRYVAEMYTRIIPQNHQFGITVWCISDSEEEHKYWKKNDAPCLWDANYIRKHAYKGFADGLAGKDVGAEFKQDTDKWDGK